MATRTAIAWACLLVGAAICTPPVCRADVNTGTPSDVRLQSPSPVPSIRVAVIADRTTGDEDGLAVLRRAVREINLLQPDVVLHIGDLVPGYKRDMRKWEEDIAAVKAILADIEAPFYPLPGNHDVITGTGDPTDRRGEDLYRKHFGPLYYSFDCGFAHFVMLDTEEQLQSQPRFSDRQIAWLKDDLARTDARSIFIFMHKPAWEMATYPDSRWDEVERILRRHPVRAVMAGHFHHYYKSVERDGVQYYVLGVTGGQVFSPELAGGLEHYCLLTVRPEDYRMALVRPGAVLADDYVANADFKNMEKLRFLGEASTGITSSVRSPETGDVSDRFSAVVTNPLDVPLPVLVRGVKAGGWSFDPPERSLLLDAGTRRDLRITARCARKNAGDVAVPEVEFVYRYTDSKGRQVPIVLRRRIPLKRTVSLEMGRPGIELDGEPEEAAWKDAAVLTTRRWRVSPYETDEPGPTFRLLATAAGVFLYADSQDDAVSDFRGDRMLSDAVFLGAYGTQPEVTPPDLLHAPIIVIYPFSRPMQAETAFWDARDPRGVGAQGVHAAMERKNGNRGWALEAFVPWDDLLAQHTPPGDEVFLNVGAWDNDGELFTELYSWAPTHDAANWGRAELK